jgi:hypothetical protein
MENLRVLPVLESCEGTMEKAQSLKYVPSDMFADGSGAPFTLTSRTATGYLSSKYPTWAVEGIASIGVSQLTPHEFLDDLRSLVNEDPQSFRSRSLHWHTQLAESLYKLTTDEKLLSLMQNIDLVPLQDGTWTSAEGKSMFFAKGKSSLKIPSGINVLVVDESVELDVSRRKLYVSLGVKAWEASKICRLILRVHESPTFDAKALTAEQLISHVVFLYKASWQPPKDVAIWFATVRDERCIGRQLYVAGSVAPDSSAARVFAKLQERFPVIHNGYLEALPSDADWPHWLVKNLGLSMIPRLITPLIEPTPQPVQNTQHSDLSVAAPTDAVAVSTERHNHALQDYQMQLMLLEQQNKKRLLMARQEQDTVDPQSPTTEPPPSKVYSLFSLPRSEPRLGDPSSYADDRRHGSRSRSRIKSPRRAVAETVAAAGVAGLAAHETAKRRDRKQAQKERENPSTGTAKHDTSALPFAPIHSEAKTLDLGLDFSGGETENFDFDFDSFLQNPQDAMDLNGAHMESYLHGLHMREEAPQPIIVRERSPSVHYEERQVARPQPSQDEDLPAQHHEPEVVFDMSEEFSYMVRECQSSDVLQVLKDNWRHYSQWIEGVHMSWQSPGFVESCVQLKKKLGSYEVISACGTKPLRETVLPAIDHQLDQGTYIPAVNIEDPHHTEWKLLGFFGVILVADVHYYLRCLIAMVEHSHADIDHVTYVYEKIQSFYRGSEDLIRCVYVICVCFASANPRSVRFSLSET